jgi:hypothetical protein
MIGPKCFNHEQVINNFFQAADERLLKSVSDAATE